MSHTPHTHAYPLDATAELPDEDDYQDEDDGAGFHAWQAEQERIAAAERRPLRRMRANW